MFLRDCSGSERLEYHCEYSGRKLGPRGVTGAECQATCTHAWHASNKKKREAFVGPVTPVLWALGLLRQIHSLLPAHRCWKVAGADSVLGSTPVPHLWNPGSLKHAFYGSVILLFHVGPVGNLADSLSSPIWGGVIACQSWTNASRTALACACRSCLHSDNWDFLGDCTNTRVVCFPRGCAKERYVTLSAT
jgi:hypothetical protein